MSEIPFVQRLGDAIEQAASARIAARRSRIRLRITIGALGFALLAGGTAAATGVFSTPEQLASSSVGCYDRPSLDGNVSILSTTDRSPVATCAKVLGTDGALTACAARGHVAVLPGGPEVCEQVGLAPLPADYAPARTKVVAFAREVGAIEASADCIPPRRLAQRVQALLDRSGWAGWRTTVREDVSDGPCGTVTGLGGDGNRTIEGALSTGTRQVFVFAGPTRSLETLLYGAHEPLAPELQDLSGERCYAAAELQAEVRARIAATGRTVSFTTSTDSGEPFGARGERLAEGCAIVSDVTPAGDGRGIVVAIRTDA